MKIAKNRKLAKMGRQGDDRYAIYIPVDMYREENFPFHYGDMIVLKIIDGQFIATKEPEKSKAK